MSNSTGQILFRLNSNANKILLVGIFLSLYSRPISAQITTPNSHLTITSFNDNWGGAFTPIKDDYRSFGFGVDYQFKPFGPRVAQINANWSGLTNKLATDSSRVDELELVLRIPVITLGNFLKFDAITGGYLIGNLGGEQFQNRAHDAVNGTQINVPYSSQTNAFFILGAKIWGELPILNSIANKELVFLPSMQYNWASNYLQQIDLKAGLASRNSYGDQIQVNFGFEFTNAFAESTRIAVANKEKGFYINYVMRLGLANFGITVYPESNFSMGQLGITLFNWQNRETLKQVDVITEFGTLFNDNGFYLRYLWNDLTHHSEHFQFDFQYQFWSLTAGKLTDYPNRYGAYHQFSLGGNYSFIKPKASFQILPYLSARLGVKNEKTHSGEMSMPNYSVWSLNAIGEGGLRIKLPANFIHKNCYYGATCNYQYVFTLFQNKDYDMESNYSFAQDLGYFGLGAFVMVDF